MRSYESRKICMVKVVTTTNCLCVQLFRLHFSTSVLRNEIKFGLVLAPNSVGLGPNMGLGGSCSLSVISTFTWHHSKCTPMVKVVTAHVCAQSVLRSFSKTVPWICLKFGVFGAEICTIMPPLDSLCDSIILCRSQKFNILAQNHGLL